MIPVPVLFINYLFMLCLILFYKLFGERKYLLVYVLIFWNEIKIASTRNFCKLSVLV